MSPLGQKQTPPHGIYSRGREPPSCNFNTILEREPCTALQQRMRATSALGQKRTSDHLGSMSALPPKADIDGHSPNVRLVP
jgi:hypothetical protein